MKSCEAKLAKFDSLKPPPLPAVRGVTDADEPAAADVSPGRRQLEASGRAGRAGLSRHFSAHRTAEIVRRRTRRTTHRPPRGAGRLADSARPSAHRPRHGQSDVATITSAQESSPRRTILAHGRAADASRVARLAGGRIDGSRLEPEGNAPADGHSATYRQSAIVDPKNEMHAKALAADSGNKLLWHARRQRLDGRSAARCGAVQVAGDLNPRMFGPSAVRNCRRASGKYAWKPDAKAGRPQPPLDLCARQAQFAAPAARTPSTCPTCTIAAPVAARRRPRRKRC